MGISSVPIRDGKENEEKYRLLGISDTLKGEQVITNLVNKQRDIWRSFTALQVAVFEYDDGIIEKKQAIAAMDDCIAAVNKSYQEYRKSILRGDDAKETAP